LNFYFLLIACQSLLLIIVLLMLTIYLQKRRSKKREKSSNVEASSATEALAMVLQEKKLSNKINYKVLDDLKALSSFVPSSPSPLTAGASVKGLLGAGSTVASSILRTDSKFDT
jgi:hypothetical protein